LTKQRVGFNVFTDKDFSGAKAMTHPVHPVHPVVNNLLLNGGAVIGGMPLLREIAEFYGRRLAKGKYLALEVPSRKPTRVMRATNMTMKIIVIGVIPQKAGASVTLLSSPGSWKERMELLALCECEQ
jgi:hypothetical protein